MNGKAYGIFFDNTYRSNFDFGIESPGLLFIRIGRRRESILLHCGTRSAQSLCRRLLIFTGHTELPPYWTLGFQQSRYSYYPEARVLEVAKTFREKRIPATPFISILITSKDTRRLRSIASIFQHSSRW